MKKRILLIEDEELLSSAFSLILQKDGYEVRVAENGKKALQLIPEYKPDLIFLDLLMPVMGGVDFLKKYKPGDDSHPPVVVISNLHDQEIVEEVRGLGASDYVVKSQMTPAAMLKLAKGMIT